MEKIYVSVFKKVRDSEKYKGVSEVIDSSGLTKFRITVKRGTQRLYFDTEREAAVAYDKKLIQLGKKPVNILKSI